MRMTTGESWMLDWVNIVLRTLMCLAFLVLVVRPMMLSVVRREPSQEALEELAASAVESAFKAWRQNDSAPAYYNDPKLALLVAQNPNLAQLPPEPTPEEKAKAEAEAAKAEAAKSEEKTADAPTTPGQSVAPTDTSAALAATPITDPATQPGTSSAAATPSKAVVVAPGDAEADASAQAAAAEEELDPGEQLKQMRDRMKQEQKKAAKPTIPAELLDNANSYEDKLALVRMIVSQEHDRVAATIRRMVQGN
jgi:hypothetical protein